MTRRTEYTYQDFSQLDALETDWDYSGTFSTDNEWEFTYNAKGNMTEKNLDRDDDGNFDDTYDMAYDDLNMIGGSVGQGDFDFKPGVSLTGNFGLTNYTDIVGPAMCEAQVE